MGSKHIMLLVYFLKIEHSCPVFDPTWIIPLIGIICERETSKLFMVINYEDEYGYLIDNEIRHLGLIVLLFDWLNKIKVLIFLFDDHN